jgi:hypothetical protein
MKRYDIKENGVTVNTVLADLAFVQANYPGRFQESAQQSVSAAPADYAVSKRVLYNRIDALVPGIFDTLEADSIDLAKPAPVRAALKKMLRNFDLTTYVQLDSVDTQTFLSGLVSLGYISAGNKTAVSVPAAQDEVWNGPR